MKHEKYQAFIESTYYLAEPRIPINVEAHNPELDNYLSAQNCQSWVFISAWNPQGELSNEESNKTNQESLQSDLPDYRWKIAYGVSADKSWVEESILVCDLSLEQAEILARKYDQAAIIYGTLGKASCLYFIPYYS